MNQYSKTVSEEITIQGKPYNNFNKVSEIYLSPAPAGSGYQFHVDRESIPYDLYHLRGVQERGARFNVVTAQSDTLLENSQKVKGPTIKVVEHLVSALTAKGLTDLHIHFDSKRKHTFFVPIVGPGIKGIVDAIGEKTKETIPLEGGMSTGIIDPSYLHLSKKFDGFSGPFDVSFDSLERTIRYFQTKGPLERSLAVTPHTTFSPCVESAKQDDVVDLYEDAVIIEDIHQLDSDDLRARPLARVATLKAKMALSLVRGLGICNGISPETYFFANPGDGILRIVGKMFPKFRAGHNEHLVHTAVSDFPGEIQALCASLGVQDLQARITLANTNHLFRVAAIKQIYKDRLFITGQ